MPSLMSPPHFTYCRCQENLWVYLKLFRMYHVSVAFSDRLGCLVDVYVCRIDKLEVHTLAPHSFFLQHSELHSSPRAVSLSQAIELFMWLEDLTCFVSLIKSACISAQLGVEDLRTM